MSTRLPRLLLLLLLAPGCSAKDAGVRSEDSGGGRDGGAIRDASLISLRVTPEVAKPGEKVAALASVQGVVGSYSWSVLDPLAQPLTVTPDAGGSAVSYTATMIGTYRVRCTAVLGSGDKISLEVTPRVEDPDAPARTYLMRITPPAGSPYASRDVTLQLQSADHEGHWSLEERVARAVTVTWGGAALDTVVRVFASAEDPAPSEVLLKGGVGTLTLPQQFQALLLPAVAKKAAAAVLANQTLMGFPPKVELSAGTPVSGTLRDPGGPIAGATVTLHTINPATKLRAPSTLAVTDASGAFSLLARAEPGASTATALTVAPPGGLGLPLAVVDPITPFPGAGSWEFTYQPPQAVTVSGTLSRADASGTPAAGAVVVLTRDDPTPIGQLIIDGKSLDAAGRHVQTLVSDAAGTLRDPQTGSVQVKLPAGSYLTDLWPAPTEAADQGHRRLKTVLGGGAQQLALALGKRVQLSGRVASSVPGQAQVRSLITARAEAGAFLAASDAQGNFALLVDDATSYLLSARALGPTAGREGAFVLSKVAVQGNQALGTLQLPPALLVSGTVLSAATSPVVGALIRIWCIDPACTSQEIVDETQSLTDGSFTLRVPVARK